MNKAVIILYVVALLFCGCNKLKEGKVLSKHYEPETQYMMLMPVCVSTGKSMITVMIPYWITDNEDWVVEIEGVHDGERVVESVYVSQKQYWCLREGSHLTLGDDCSEEDENNTKEER